MGGQFTDNTSTATVTSKLCTYINNKSIVSMAFMFFDSQATVIDLSSINTSNVTNMSSMFDGSAATAVDLSNFDTSKVTNMSGMFYGSAATMLDLSSFDTRNVTDMGGMFYYNKAITIDLSSLDTSNVTNMKNMFCESQATVLDLSSFDTSKVTDMSYMFYNSTNLKTIYVSNGINTDAVTSSSNMFNNCTSLVGGSGTKFNSSYTNKTYARIDTASTPGYFTDIADKPSTFDTDDWATIVKSVKAGNTRKYKVGDTKEVDLGTTYGTHTVRIANTSTPSECSTEGFSQTACGFVLEFADIITKNKMNDTATNVGGWPATSLRTFVNNDIYNALPNDLKNGIIDTTVVSSHGKDDSSNFTSTDKLYLLAPKELYSDFDLTFDTANDLTRQLDYYKNEGVTTSSYSKAIKKYNSTATWWWFRSASSINNYIFYFVYDDGNRHDNIANSTNGVSPAFRIG